MLLGVRRIEDAAFRILNRILEVPAFVPSLENICLRCL